MAFFAIVMALLLEQVRPMAAGNVFSTLVRRWVRGVGRNVDAGTARHAWLAWALAVGTPALLALGLHKALMWLGGWPLALLWGVAVLYLTLGLRQFGHHFTGLREALEADDEARARQLLAQWQQVDVATLPRTEIVRHVLEHAVLTAHRHVFGVLAWFSLGALFGLGPAGALIYRVADFVARYWGRKARAADGSASPALGAAAQAAWHAMDWLPARLTAVGFAIAGSFEDAIDVWRRYAPRLGGGGNEGVILAATAGAMDVRLGHPGAALPGRAPQASHLTQVVGLVWRTVALWLLLLVLLTLAHVLG
ncbi:MAG: cobalamin biosynthesis protein [Comamonadaceae bacterium]|nr:cobalamin biosynthesis protein [Comamonadaceae bacterium]